MATELTERLDSREWTFGPKRAVTMHYAMVGTSDDVAMKAELEAALATNYAGLKRDEIRMEPVHVDTVRDFGRYDVTVKYVEYPALSFPSTGESTFTFETIGGTQHTLVSKETVDAAALDGYASNCHQAIGVTDDGVSGVDIIVPVYGFSETHYIDAEDVDQAYKIALFNLTGKVNNAPFRGFAAGEVLFLGASGGQRASGNDWEITFRFSASPNATGLAIGGMTVNKKGWEYVWCRFAPDGQTNAVVTKPVEVFVERLYDYADFTGLGI